MMNTYMDDGKLVVKLKADEVTSAIKEYENYMKSKGETFKKEWMRFPTPSHFLAIYFGNLRFCSIDTLYKKSYSMQISL